MIKKIQYIALAILLVIFLEGMTTLGGVFHFEQYNIFGWIVQVIILIATVTTALRIESEK
jgi:hypothetical protein